ncbi:MAG TPA: SpoIIE family protein phosphatase, partial [Opitutus sp.]|nr:SpoIIE family protein phosphatase [Opitutus sp.]
FVGSDGIALGMVGDEVFSAALADRTESFVAGDLLVLYTDGLTEAPNEDEKEFAGFRLADAVFSARNGSARQVNDSVLEALQRFAGDGVKRDDLTLVTIRRD